MSSSTKPAAGTAGAKSTAPAQPAQLPADQHFKRMVVLALIQGRALATTMPLDESRVQGFIKQAELTLAEVKAAEARG